MNLEQYIAKRKQEDNINEFDLSQRAENTKICVNYIFEFFNNYVDSVKEIEAPTDPNNKIEKYKKMVRQYDDDIRDWLVALYIDSGKQIHKILDNQINDEFYYLFSSDAEFRALSYDVYANIVRRYPFFKDQTEMIYRFIKDDHRINSRISEDEEQLFLTDSISEWFHTTYKKYGVNIYMFCYDYVFTFLEDPSKWPKETKNKTKYYNDYMEKKKKGERNFLPERYIWEYDYKKATDPFNISSLYRRMPKKAFTKGRKTDFLHVMMYYAMNNYYGDYDYWENYYSALNKA